MDQMTAAEAHVVTLVAEVRALMVGSRQITLSVFRQLDTVDYSQCEIMGRVSVSEGGRWVVGRGPSGALVRARWEGEFPRWDATDLNEYRTLQNKKASGQSLDAYEARNLDNLEDFRRNEERYQAEYRADLAAHDALPLIVLAGLR